MAIAELAYGLAMRTVRLLSPVLALGSSKLARGVRGRRGAVERLEAWSRQNRDRASPLIWFHAPSVGEGLQARAVIEALSDRRPGLRFAFTHFSPSAEALARDMPVDVAEYLPWDVSADVRRALGALDPALVVFTKSEVWPVLAREAQRRGIPLALVGATLPAEASRLREPGRGFLQKTFGRLARVAAVAEPDAGRFELLGVAGDAVEVTGDPGIDSAATRAARAEPDAAYLRPFRVSPAPTLVAGSTWPSDEAVLLPALDRVRRTVTEVRVVVAPHEPSEEHVSSLVSKLSGMGFTSRTLAEVEVAGDARDAQAVVVERVGVLAHLYTIGTVAFVGGGFHAEGLHSVLEPAAAGLPVLFGPGHRNAVAAAHLLDRGGARVVSDAHELGEALEDWLTADGRREEAARAAAGYIEEHRGAADRTARTVMRLLDSAR